MWRVIFYFAIIALLALGLAWFADRPGEITLTWLDYEIETSLLVAAGGLAVALGLIWFVWSAIAGVLGAPGMIADFFKLRRRTHGFEALTKGMLAAGAGDAALASKYSIQAGRWLAGEPLTVLLKAQAAQLSGDEVQAERLFQSMLLSPETELLGLHGLFVQARRRRDTKNVKALAQTAFAREPGLAWAAQAVLTSQSADQDWQAAEQTLALSQSNKLIDKAEANRKRAVLLCARAVELEERDDDLALSLAQNAHKLAPDLVPAAAIAGRILAAQGHPVRAARVLAKTWRLAPHPDIAEIYGAVRSGDSPRERVKRVRMLLRKSSGGDEGAFALARAAADAREWRSARAALAPLLGVDQSARVCALMAEIEDGEFGDRGKVREWLARAVQAPRDPAWTADGFVSEIWLPVSPVTGELDRFEWKVPLEAIGRARPLELALPGHAAVPPGEAVANGSPADEGGDGEEPASTPVATQPEEVPKSVPPASEDAAVPVEEKSNKAKPKSQAKGDKPAAEVPQPVMYQAPPAPDDPGPSDKKTKPGGWLSGLFS